MNIWDTGNSFQIGCLSSLKIGGGKTCYTCQSLWVKPVSLLKAWCSRCTDPLQPITAVVRGPDANGCLPAVPEFSPLCGSQKAVWAYLLTSEVVRQLSLKQIQERNSNIITGHAILGSMARRLVVWRTCSPMSKHAQSLLSSDFFLFGIQIILQDLQEK